MTAQSEFMDFYAILQILNTAEPEVIRAVYKRLSNKYHPDHNKSSYAEERMTKINLAYETLSDPQKRRQYDVIWHDKSSYATSRKPGSSEWELEKLKDELTKEKEKEASNFAVWQRTQADFIVIQRQAEYEITKLKNELAAEKTKSESYLKRWQQSQNDLINTKREVESNNGASKQITKDNNEEAEDAFMHFCQGNNCKTQGKLEEAIREYQKVLKINPNFTPAKNNLEEVLKTQGRHSEAAQKHRPSPTDADYHYKRAFNMEHEGNETEALKEWRIFVTLAHEMPSKKDMVVTAKYRIESLERKLRI